MRRIDRATREAFGAEVVSGCLCWLLTRRDGAIFGITDHDRGLTVDGVDFDPVGALEAGWMSGSGSLAPGQLSAKGGIRAEFLTQEDMDSGVWNGALVEIFRVDWRNTEHRVSVWSGRFGDISRRGGSHSTELVDLKVDLESPVGEVYGRRCSAELGDRRCGVDLSGSLYSGSGRIEEVRGDREYVVSGLGSYASGWFSSGVLIFAGSGSGERFRVVSHDRSDRQVLLVLGRAPSGAVEVSDGFVVTAGCDKTFGVCSGKFSNHLNFRGFPFLLGNDAVLSGPWGDGRDDGSSR